MDMDALRHRLRDAPLDFLSAVSSSTLQTFDIEWRSLCEDVDKATHLLLLNDEDASLIHATASLLATLSESLMKVDDESVKKTEVFVEDMENIFGRLTLVDVDYDARRVSPPTALYKRLRSSSDITPPYISSAYSWITQNIHDPYPSSAIKERISQEAGRPLRVITDWFKTVRRHIGWVSICKSHFQGSRAVAVQAAKHVYLHTISTPPLSLTPEIIFQFEVIRTRLDDMYSLVDDSGDSSDSTDDYSTTPSLSMPSRRSPLDQSPYARSHSSSSTPSLVFSTDDEDSHSLASFTSDDGLASLGKRKNRTEEDGLRPLKRNRSGFINVTDGLVTDVTPTVSAAQSSAIPDSPFPSQCTPSRKRRLSIAASDCQDTKSTASASPPTCDPRPPLRIPKRRLSMSDSQPTSKRPCLPPTVGPRKQAVSTPIPVPYQATPDVDDWFRTFEMPDTSLSVELFNWDVVVENDAFLYNSLFDATLQSDGQDPSNVTPLLDAYQSPTPLDLGVSSAVDPSVLDISSTFIESPALISTFSPEPITATASSAFDFLDAFLSAVNAEPHTAPSSSTSPSTELSLNDTIDLFGESVVMP